jgi:hypothetical protein
MNDFVAAALIVELLTPADSLQKQARPRTSWAEGAERREFAIAAIKGNRAADLLQIAQ